MLVFSIDLGITMRNKNKKINVQGSEITVIATNEQDYISLTDMVRDIENGLCPISIFAERQ